MPSGILAEIMVQIENLETDDFAKFYMYSALLNTITDANTLTDKRKPFIDFLPKYTLPLFPDVPLMIGSPSPRLVAFIAQYSIEMKQQQTPMIISDLLCILDKMLAHLSAITKKSTKNNDAIYGAMTFGDCQENIDAYLKSAIQLNQARHKLVLKLIGTAVVLLIVLQCSYFAPLLLGLAISAIAMILAYGFVQHTKKELNIAKEKYAQSEVALRDGKERFILKTLYDKFFISSIVTPIQQTTDYIKTIAPISEDKIPELPCFRR